MKLILLLGAGMLWPLSPPLAIVCFVVVSAAMWGEPMSGRKDSD